MHTIARAMLNLFDQWGPGRHVRLTRLLGVSLALGVFVMASANAQAITFDFCGTSSNPVLLSGSSLPNDRCADSNNRQWSYVRSYPNANYPTCAIVKEYSNGGGHNISSPACGWPGPGGYEQSTCSCAGYGTITDDQTAVGYYFGFGKSP